jgi:small subunit ribosomal protein S10
MKFRLILRSYNPYAINIVCRRFLKFFETNGCETSKLIRLPTKIKRFCVLRSPHIDKASREHFELRIYKRFIDITNITPPILDLFLRLTIPSGVFCDLKLNDSNLQVLDKSKEIDEQLNSLKQLKVGIKKEKRKAEILEYFSEGDEQLEI